MSSVFEDIMESLNELNDAANGKETGIVVHRFEVKEVESFSPEEIKLIRNKAEMTQKIFAACIGVSVKSVEAWEGGRSRPDGAARRLISLIRDNPKFAIVNGICIPSQS